MISVYISDKVNFQCYYNFSSDYLFISCAFSIDQVFCLSSFLQVDHCFDIFVSRLCEAIFMYYKSWAARSVIFLSYPAFLLITPPTNLFYWWMPKPCSELLDPTFIFASDNAEKYAVQPMRLNMLLKMTRVKVSGLRYHNVSLPRFNLVFWSINWTSLTYSTIFGWVNFHSKCLGWGKIGRLENIITQVLCCYVHILLLSF